MININGIDYEICFENADFSPGAMGRTDIKTGKILIDASMKTDIKNNTLLHEIFHIFYNSCGLSEKSTEEEIVEAMSNQMFSAMQNNKDLFIKMIINE